MVYAGVDRPAPQNSSVVPGPPASRPSRPARARRHFAPLAYGSLLPPVEPLFLTLAPPSQRPIGCCRTWCPATSALSELGLPGRQVANWHPAGGQYFRVHERRKGKSVQIYPQEEGRPKILKEDITLVRAGRKSLIQSGALRSAKACTREAPRVLCALTDIRFATATRSSFASASVTAIITVFSCGCPLSTARHSPGLN